MSKIVDYSNSNDDLARKKTREKIYIAIFAIVALASGWIGLLIDMLLPEQIDEQTLGMGIWLVLPFLCGSAIRAFRKDWKDFGVKPKFKGNMKWYALAILIFPAITLIFTLIAWIFRQVSSSSFSVSSVIPLIASMFIGLLIKNIFEDFAFGRFFSNWSLAEKEAR